MYKTTMYDVTEFAGDVLFVVLFVKQLTRTCHKTLTGTSRSKTPLGADTHVSTSSPDHTWKAMRLPIYPSPENDQS